MKSKQISIIIISSLILLPFLTEGSFAQENHVGMELGKDAYSAGEPIVVTGFVESKIGDEVVTLRIFNPMNNLITIKQIEVNNDGTFSGEIPTSIGGQWAKDGTYTIIVNYYTSDPVTVQFEYGGMVSAGVAAEESIPEYSMDEEKLLQTIMLEDYEVGYDLTGAKIIRITPDYEMKSLIIEIETYSDGELRITFPKDVIDTDEEGFFVLVDGMKTNHEAKSNLDNWNFVIPFSNDSEEIEIVGTYVIPEFGTIAALVLLIAISTIIMISVKNKQIFYPKI